jgi:hypothetical protein
MLETTSPVKSSQALATQTSFHVKNCVKVKSGETLLSITYLKPAKTPTDTTHPEIAANMPSSKNGNWIEKLEAPTNFITPVSRLRLKAAILRVLLISSEAVKTEAAPIINAPFRNTANNLKNLSRIAR